MKNSNFLLLLLLSGMVFVQSFNMGCSDGSTENSNGDTETGEDVDGGTDENTDVDGGADTSTETGTDTDAELIACDWSTLFEDDFDRADGELGDDYTVQVGSPDTDILQIIDNEMVVDSVSYYAVSYNGSIDEYGVRASVDFTYTVSAETDGEPVIALIVAADDDGTVPYFCGINLGQGAISITTWEPSDEDPTGIYTDLASAPVSFETDTVYTMECTYNQGNYTARLLDETGDEITMLEAGDDNGQVAELVAINGGDTGSVKLSYDNLKVDVCQ